MNETVKEILKVWYLAHKHANDNPRILRMTTKEYDFSKLCSLRMNEVFFCDGMLYSLQIKNEYPHELIRHLEAEKNKSNCECSYYSVMSKKHPECIKKSSEWFGSQRELMQYIENNLIN